MKGIIVIDKPEACVDCEFCREIDEGLEACCILATDENDPELYRMIDDYCQHVPQWCKIKNIPEKKKPSKFPVSPILPWEFTDYEKGYNECIDELLKGDK